MSSQEILFHLSVCISYLWSVWVNSHNSVFSSSWCGKAHTEWERINISFITVLPRQLAGDGVSTSRESRKGENKLFRAFAKPGTWSGGDEAWVSWPCSEQAFGRGSYSWLQSPLLTCHRCAPFPPDIASSKFQQKWKPSSYHRTQQCIASFSPFSCSNLPVAQFAALHGCFQRAWFSPQYFSATDTELQWYFRVCQMD